MGDERGEGTNFGLGRRGSQEAMGGCEQSRGRGGLETEMERKGGIAGGEGWRGGWNQTMAVLLVWAYRAGDSGVKTRTLASCCADAERFRHQRERSSS